MKIEEGILPGALVKCINDESKFYYCGIKRGQLYTVKATALYGAAIYIEGSSVPYSTERFHLIYNDRENFNQEPVVDVEYWQ